MTIGVGVDVGAQLAAYLQSVPKWLRDRMNGASEGSAKATMFGAFVWHDGYGRLSSFGLPVYDHYVEGPLTEPTNAFWSDPKHPERAIARDAALKKVAQLKFSTSFDPLAPVKAAGQAFNTVENAVGKIPVIGPVLKAQAAPFTALANLAQGERIDHALLGAMKDQLAAAKAIAPYAATIVSFVPGIGTGVAAAIAAGAALAEGKPIDQALEDAVKASIPGGALAASGFELAKKVASGENVGKAALESARTALPPEAQKAFDIGLAVVSGKSIQNTLIAAVASLAPGELQQVLDVGAKAIKSTPGLAALASSLSNDIAKQGLQLAAGALAHAGVNEAQIRAMQAKLTGDTLAGFNSALKSQVAHFPWLSSLAGSAPAPQTAATPPPLVIDASKLAARAMTPAPVVAPTPHEPTKAAPAPHEPTKSAPAPVPREPTRAAPAAPTAPAAGPFANLPYPQR